MTWSFFPYPSNHGESDGVGRGAVEEGVDLSVPAAPQDGKQIQHDSADRLHRHKLQSHSVSVSEQEHINFAMQLQKRHQNHVKPKTPGSYQTTKAETEEFAAR